jgi:hypothetical protein
MKEKPKELSLREKRVLFSLLFAKLIIRVRERGYECAIDQVKRTDAEAKVNAESGKGISNSLHIIGLAGDLLLYKDGKYLKQTEEYEEFGIFWEGLHPLCRWGGRFKRADGNHFSVEHEGVK